MISCARPHRAAWPSKLRRSCTILSVRATMHGFVNVFVAAAFAWQGAERDAILDVLNEGDAGAFQFLTGELRWHGRSITVARSSARAAISRTALARVRSRSLSRIYRLWGGLLSFSGAAPRAAAAARAAQGAAPLT